MQKITNLILMCFAVVLLTASCKKNQSNEDYTETEEPIIPVFTEKVNCTVSGFIVNEQSEPVPGASVSAGALTVTTDEFGYFKITGASLTKSIGLVKVARTGYFTGFKTVIAKAAGQYFFRLMLLNKVETGTLAGSTGGTVSTADGVSITLPANAVVDAGSGAVYSGSVHVSAKRLPHTTSTETMFTIPGDERGVNSNGHLRSLNTHASIAVDLNGDAGQKLQLAPGIKAGIVLPIEAVLQSKAPATIAMWSFDEEKGLWKEEGTLSRNGNNYIGQASHFSFWSGATSMALVNFSAQVLSSTLQPLANVPVVITFAGQPLNSGHGKFAFTDANGFVNGPIPANSNFVLNVMTTCSITAYDHNFSTGTSDIDLGAITGNLGQSAVSLTGTVTNCAGQPLTDGYVQTYDHGFYNRIPVINGSFNFTGLLCNNQPVNYVAVDNATHQQSAPQTINLLPGNNNLGSLSACGISNLGAVTYVIDGLSRTIAEPADTLAGYYFSSGGITTIVKLSGSGSSDFTFQFDGGTALGSLHKVRDIWSIGFASGRAEAPLPLDVNITEFGGVGGFIAGSFTGVVNDFSTAASYTVTYNFRIKRLN